LVGVRASCCRWLCVVDVVSAWVVTPSCVWLARHWGFSYWSSRPLWRECGCCPLAGMCHRVCVRRVVVLSVLDFCMFHLVAQCANVKSLLFVVWSACVVFVVSCVVQLLSSLSSCLKKKKKNCTFCFACCCNDGGVTKNTAQYYMIVKSPPITVPEKPPLNIVSFFI